MNAVSWPWLSFVVGGIWVATASAVAEKQGTRLGGFLGGMPSTLAVALLFVALSGGTEAAASAAAVVPLSFAANALFVLLFAALSRWGFHLGMALALAAWAAMQAWIVSSGGAPPIIVLAAWTLSLGLCRYGFRALRIQPMPSAGSGVRARILLLRAFAGGLLVATAVACSIHWGAVAGGVLASLPIIFISTLIIAYRSAGIDFARSLGRTLAFSAMVNCSAFALTFQATLHALSPLPAFALSYAITLLLAIPLYRFKFG